MVGCWRGYLSGARCRLAYGPADATATHCLLLQIFQSGFTFLVLAHPVVPDKGPLNERAHVCVYFMIISSYFSYAYSIVYFTFCAIAILSALNSVADTFVTCFSINTLYRTH